MKKKMVIVLIITSIVFFWFNSNVLASEANPLGTVTCGTGAMNFPAVIPNLISICIKLVKYGVPSLLIILGMIDFAKATISGDDKVMETSKKNFVRRIIIAVVLFLIVSIITWVFTLISSRSNGDIDNNSITDCINCFIHGSDSSYCTNKKDN